MLKYNGAPKKIQPTQNLNDFFQMLNLSDKPQDYKWYANGNLVNPNFTVPIFTQIPAGQNVTLEKIIVTPPPAQTQQPQTQQPQIQQQQQQNTEQQNQFKQAPNPFSQAKAPQQQQAQNVSQPIIKPMPIKKIIQTQLKPVQPVSTVTLQRQPQPCSGNKTSGKKTVGQFECEIEEFGNIVNLRASDGTLNVILREDQSSPEATKSINLSQNEVSGLEEHILRLNGTKVMFLKGLTGVAVRWATGMVTKFELYLDEL